MPKGHFGFSDFCRQNALNSGYRVQGWGSCGANGAGGTQKWPFGVILSEAGHSRAACFLACMSKGKSLRQDSIEALNMTVQLG